MQLPITIGLHRSFLGLVGLVAAHGLAAVLVLATPWQLWLMAGVLAATAASLLACLSLWKGRVETLRLLPDGKLQCRLAGQSDLVDVEILPGATVHPWITALRLRTAEGTYAVAVFPDSATAAELRRLRVWLRWRGKFSGGAGGA